MILLFAVVLITMLWPSPALAKDGMEDWAWPYIREMQRLKFLPEEQPIQTDVRISRSVFSKMLSAYLKVQRIEETSCLSEQMERNRIDDWVEKQLGKDTFVRRIEAIRAFGRVDGVELAGETQSVYKDCDYLSEEDQSFLGHYRNEQRIHGYPDGSFGPEEYLTYGEASCLFYQALYADTQERSLTNLEEVKLESLVEQDYFDRSSQWAWSVCPRLEEGNLYLHDGEYPLDLGRFRIFGLPVMHTSESGRRWIGLEMDYAKECPKGFDIYVICNGGRRFLRRSNFDEYFQVQAGLAQIYYPLVSKYDSFTLDDQYGLDYHFEDCNWADYDGEDIEYLLLYDPLFGLWLALPWSLDEVL
jgi:hypothetical protein